ncbi:MAG: hypothetical protein, partial [Olavius algarvensis Gamma 3 endosymbiont]
WFFLPALRHYPQGRKHPNRSSTTAASFFFIARYPMGD